MKKKVKKISLKDFWKKLWSLISVSHRQIKWLAVVLLFMEITALIGPYILKLIIDALTNFNQEDILLLLGLVAAMFLANQFHSLIDYVSDRKIFRIIADIEVFILKNAHQKMMFLDLNYHARENTGNKIIKIQKGVERIRHLMSSVFWEVIPTVFQILLTAIILFAIDWRFGLIVCFFAPIFLLLTFKANKKAHPYRVERFDKDEESSGLMAQSIININTVKSFVQERREVLQYKNVIKKILSLYTREYDILLNHNLLRMLTIDLGRILILLFGIYLVWNGSITIGSLVFIVTISEKALISLFRISRLYDQIMQSSEAVERLYTLSQDKSEIKNPKRGLKPKTVMGKIELENASYTFKDSGIKALDDVSVRIPSDSITALVGPSGGGKTTLARMIYRHYDLQKGSISLDGTDLKKYDLYGFRKFIAIVPQEVEIFNASVRNNIAYAKPRASIKEVRAAARVANAEEFIDQLEKGYDTMVGERGIKLSGGQRQRIGIARGILANPRILIFDEATSSLDSQSEKLIQDAIDKISQNRTMIIIAHRLSTIKKADKIFVLENGKIVEQGSHAELSRLDGGLYKKLLSLQEMGDVK